MVKSKLIIISLFIFSCSSSVPFSDLVQDEGFTYYNNNKFSGLAIEKDNSGIIRVEKIYKDGINLSTKLIDNKGNIESEWTYSRNKIMVSRFYDNGKIESKEVFDKNLVRNGESKSFYKNGNLKSEWVFKNGLRDGLQKNYFGNGKLTDEREMTNGVENGFTRIYNREGELIKEVYYKNGLIVKI
tara:strand:- start:2358 stop:2912 length:555 start_codon:yes stop_codon:yes gene_type:complete